MRLAGPAAQELELAHPAGGTVAVLVLPAKAPVRPALLLPAGVARPVHVQLADQGVAVVEDAHGVPGARGARGRQLFERVAEVGLHELPAVLQLRHDLLVPVLGLLDQQARRAKRVLAAVGTSPEGAHARAVAHAHDRAQVSVVAQGTEHLERARRGTAVAVVQVAVVALLGETLHAVAATGSS